MDKIGELGSIFIIDFNCPSNELLPFNETIIPLTFLFPNGTWTLILIMASFFRFSGIKYVNVWYEDIGSETSAKIMNF